MEQVKKAIEIKITVTPEGQLQVTGFPTNLNLALNYMFKAIEGMVQFFMQQAVEGKVSQSESRIVKAHMIPKNLSKLIH